MYTAEKKGTAPEEKEPNLSRHMLHSFRSSLNASREGAEGQQGKTPFSCPALAVSRTCWSTHPHTKITISGFSHTISKCIHIHIYVHIDTHSHEHVDKIRPSRVSRGKKFPREQSKHEKKTYLRHRASSYSQRWPQSRILRAAYTQKLLNTRNGWLCSRSPNRLQRQLNLIRSGICH